MTENVAIAQVILVRKDGALILQQRDDKPGIANPGMISAFGGAVEAGEEPLDAAVREMSEETNLGLKKDALKFFKLYIDPDEMPGKTWSIYYYIAEDVDDKGLEIYEGQGYKVVRGLDEATKLNLTPHIRKVLNNYYQGVS